MQGRAFALLFVCGDFYRKKIIFVFGRQGFGKENTGHGTGTAGEKFAADLIKRGAGGEQIIEKKNMTVADGGFVKMKVSGFILVFKTFVFFTVMGDGDGIVTIGDTEQTAGCCTKILKALFMALTGRCGNDHEREGIAMHHEVGCAIR